jgi:hypothetical protein
MAQQDSVGSVEPAAPVVSKRSQILLWQGRRISVHQFVSEYAACVDSFGAEIAQTVSRFHPPAQWRTREKLETQAAMRAIVMTVFDTAIIGEPARQTPFAQVLSGLSTVWSNYTSRCTCEYVAFLARAIEYYSLRDRANHLTTGARMVGSYLDAVGLGQSSRSAVPERYLAARFSCRILADIHRIGVALPASEIVPVTVRAARVRSPASLTKNINRLLVSNTHHDAQSN